MTTQNNTVRTTTPVGATQGKPGQVYLKQGTDTQERWLGWNGGLYQDEHTAYPLSRETAVLYAGELPGPVFLIDAETGVEEQIQ